MVLAYTVTRMADGVLEFIEQTSPVITEFGARRKSKVLGRVGAGYDPLSRTGHMLVVGSLRIRVSLHQLVLARGTWTSKRPASVFPLMTDCILCPILRVVYDDAGSAPAVTGPFAYDHSGDGGGAEELRPLEGSPVCAWRWSRRAARGHREYLAFRQGSTD